MMPRPRKPFSIPWKNPLKDGLVFSESRALDRDNPRGPATGTARVLKGGSFLCHASYCDRYRVGARTGNAPAASSSHVDFRCTR